MATKKKQTKKQAEEINGAAGMLLAGCTSLGVGLGFMTGNLVSGAIIGAGVGLIAMGVLTTYYAKK